MLGVPQGVAVFQNGGRGNDPFGDVVHWALLPAFAFERVANLLDAGYATAGVLGDPEEVFPAFGDPRFQSPGEPRTFRADVRLSF